MTVSLVSCTFANHQCLKINESSCECRATDQCTAPAHFNQRPLTTKKEFLVALQNLNNCAADDWSRSAANFSGARAARAESVIVIEFADLSSGYHCYTIIPCTKISKLPIKVGSKPVQSRVSLMAVSSSGCPVATAPVLLYLRKTALLPTCCQLFGFNLKDLGMCNVGLLRDLHLGQLSIVKLLGGLKASGLMALSVIFLFHTVQYVLFSPYPVNLDSIERMGSRYRITHIFPILCLLISSVLGKYKIPHHL